jgi:hypothetical protein
MPSILIPEAGESAQRMEMAARQKEWCRKPETPYVVTYGWREHTRRGEGRAAAPAAAA